MDFSFCFLSSHHFFFALPNSLLFSKRKFPTASGENKENPRKSHEKTTNFTIKANSSNNDTAGINSRNNENNKKEKIELKKTCKGREIKVS